MNYLFLALIIGFCAFATIGFSPSTKCCHGGTCRCLIFYNCAYECNDGYGNCDLDDENGCEIDLTSDNENCGSCGNACEEYQECIDGECVGEPPSEEQAEKKLILIYEPKRATIINLYVWLTNLFKGWLY